jgi:hypothetical protein
MKALLEFDLPEEEREFGDAVNGEKYLAILQAIDSEFRACLKYESDPHEKGESDSNADLIDACAEHWRERLFQFCDDWQVSLWD